MSFMQKIKVRSLLFNELLKILDTAFSLNYSKSLSGSAHAEQFVGPVDTRRVLFSALSDR